MVYQNNKKSELMLMRCATASV